MAKTAIRAKPRKSEPARVAGPALAALKRRLLNERAVLTNEPDLREALLVAPQEEVMDKIQADEERELAGERFEEHTRVLHKVEAALARIDSGLYGLCETCGEPIPAPRLKAIPWTSHCIDCQERAEKSHAA